jgi:hypothetical protein
LGAHCSDHALEKCTDAVHAVNLYSHHTRIEGSVRAMGADAVDIDVGMQRA